MVHACKFVDEEVAEDIVHDVFVAYWEQHHMIVSSSWPPSIQSHAKQLSKLSESTKSSGELPGTVATGH